MFYCFADFKLIHAVNLSHRYVLSAKSPTHDSTMGSSHDIIVIHNIYTQFKKEKIEMGFIFCLFYFHIYKQLFTLLGNDNIIVYTVIYKLLVWVFDFVFVYE